ncbi:DUF1942 domain-containing protein [Mycobacterium lepromatosis]|uniref:DUF1942 domain-containing protein n=1 Tax=Mycobacterium lepromatosis TaxID=480418 RepID=UPI001F1CEC36|nr:DUF1942 domain-containing protein [Mycobacterium lepromatosis]
MATPSKGTLYQEDVAARSDSEVVTPMVKDFRACGPNDQTYRLVDNVSVPNGLNPAPIPQDSESRDTLYCGASRILWSMTMDCRTF